MAETAREYLIHRFRGDAQSLRDRVAALQGGAKIPGPDAGTSRRMADACDDVATMIDAVAPQDDPQAEISAIVALVPLLEQRAKANEATPPVRAVYSGAATRIREVHAAEVRGPQTGTDDAGAFGDDDDDEESEA